MYPSNENELFAHKLPFITVFTITYKQSDRVAYVVRDLLDQKYLSDRFNIIVLDDGSHDGTAELLHDIASVALIPIQVITTEHEADYLNARRWNQCIAAAPAHTDIFIQVDDVRLRPDLLWQHAKWHMQDQDYIVTGAKFEGDTETWDLSDCQRSRFSGPDGSAGPCNYLAVWAASLSFSRRTIEAIWHEPYEKPYDERMVGWGFHEIEFAYRAKEAGVQIIYDPTAGVYHKNHTSEAEQSRGLDRKTLVDTGFSQNEEYFMHKHKISKLFW